jgi:hypothetical protein
MSLKLARSKESGKRRLQNMGMRENENVFKEPPWFVLNYHLRIIRIIQGRINQHNCDNNGSEMELSAYEVDHKAWYQIMSFHVLTLILKCCYIFTGHSIVRSS